MISKEFLSILVCPESKQALCIADKVVLDSVRLRVDEGSLKSVSGSNVEGPVSEVLVRDDKKVLYIVREGIPILLIDEGIRFESIQD